MWLTKDFIGETLKCIRQKIITEKENSSLLYPYNATRHLFVIFSKFQGLFCDIAALYYGQSRLLTVEKMCLNCMRLFSV